MPKCTKLSDGILDSSTVDPRLSEPRLSEPSIIRIQKQMKIIGSKFKKLALHNYKRTRDVHVH